MPNARLPRRRPYPLLDHWWYRLWLWLRGFAQNPRADLHTTIRAANRASGISLTVFFGLVSLILFALTEVEAPAAGTVPLLSWQLPLFYWKVGLLLAGMVTAYLAGGAAALRLLSPEQYAYAVIAGNSEKEMLRLISQRACRLCVRFVLATRSSTALCDDLLSVADENFDPRTVGDGPALAAKLRDMTAQHETKPWRRLKHTQHEVYALLRREEQEIRRVEAMKLLAARELEIPPRRLCDQIIQFSPSMFREGATKYVQNLKEMIAMLPDMQTKTEVARFCGLVRQNRWLENKGRTRALRLTEMIRFRDLYGFLHAFAATHSTSGSLQVYVRSIAEVTGKNGILPLALRQEGVWQRLCFLYRKQRAHPGFDLHQLLVRVCEELQRELEAQSEPDRSENLEMVANLRHIRHLLGAVETSSTTDGRDDVPRGFGRLLAALHHAPAYVSRAIADGRARIAHTFREVLTEWSRFEPARRGDVYFVTYGYSKTVREILRECWGSPAPDRAARPFIFLLTGDTPNDELDTRRMKMEIQQHLPPGQHRLAAGHADMLLGLLAEHDRVLLVEGAECFDVDGRMVHPRTTAEQVSSLIAGLAAKQTPTLFTVVAESYKRQELPLSQTSFFADHFDRVAIYPPSSAHLIVSSDVTDPVDWKAVVRSRLAAAAREPTPAYADDAALRR